MTYGPVWTADQRVEIDTFLSCFRDGVKIVKQGKKASYYDAACALDIETTSTYDSKGAPVAFMYEWTVGLMGRVIIGRTWESLLDLFGRIADVLMLSSDLRLVIYDHNLAFEHQFLRLRLVWEKVFALKSYRPVYALCDLGIEFRCSMILSGYSLESLGKNLVRYPVEKLVGDLDYRKIRHSGTPMTEKELGYCVNDVRVVMSYIMEQIEINGDITRIPLTKTGYVRRFCRDACLRDKSSKYHDKYLRYMSLMRAMQMTPELYDMLKRAFQGGFTHANCFSSGKVLCDVESFDLTSSYPSVMLSEMFPMGSPEYVKIRSLKEFRDNIRRYCCIFDVKITGIEPRVFYEHPLSASRCRELSGAQEDNGRIVCADSLITTMTEQDFAILIKFYRWRTFEIGTFVRYEKGYLPKDLILAVLDLYQAKTELADIHGEEINYQLKKGMLNAAFGMAVTDICREEIYFEDGSWEDPDDDIDPEEDPGAYRDMIERKKKEEEEKKKEDIEKYNKSSTRFLSFEWGVFITAFARRNLFSAIFECGGGDFGGPCDYHYSDTDSVKITHPERHADYFRDYNARITAKLEKCMRFYGIPVERLRPKNAKGVEKPLGVWKDEGRYKRFKTLGAKRYLVEEEDGTISLTVAGLNKTAAVPYLMQKYKTTDKIFEVFSDELEIPAEYKDRKTKKIKSATGKSTHRYLNYNQRGEIVDYLGNVGSYNELSSVHLSGAEYSLKLSAAYADWLKGFEDFDIGA